MQWISISFLKINNFCSSSSGPKKKVATEDFENFRGALCKEFTIQFVLLATFLGSAFLEGEIAEPSLKKLREVRTQLWQGIVVSWSPQETWLQKRVQWQ